MRCFVRYFPIGLACLKLYFTLSKNKQQHFQPKRPSEPTVASKYPKSKPNGCTTHSLVHDDDFNDKPTKLRNEKGAKNKK